MNGIGLAIVIIALAPAPGRPTLSIMPLTLDRSLSIAAQEEQCRWFATELSRRFAAARDPRIAVCVRTAEA
jgi:hypothetical protein